MTRSHPAILSIAISATPSTVPSQRLRALTIGNGLGEKANDRIVARRQKRRGMQWSVQSSDALAALRTLLLNDSWETYWQERHVSSLAVARAAA